MPIKKVLFLIQSLGGGGAEKVLVNLVNNLDKERYAVTVMTLFSGGENEQQLLPHICLKTVWKKSFPGNSRLLKMFSPEVLHKMFVREKYDIEVAYLEGAAHRIISGCKDSSIKLFAWQHSEPHDAGGACIGFRSIKESELYYSRYRKIICVSDSVRRSFGSWHPSLTNLVTAYNTNESEKITRLGSEKVGAELFKKDEFKIVGIGKITWNKGFDRLANIHVKLRKEGFPVHTYILGAGQDQSAIQEFIDRKGEHDSFTFLGYQQNPYKYLSHCDLYVCTSHHEGFSTAATEALIVGTPVCTVEVSGMKEMLGENNEYGLVTENDDESLYRGIRRLLTEPGLWEHYKKQANRRGKDFSTENTVAAVERIFQKERL